MIISLKGHQQGAIFYFYQLVTFPVLLSRPRNGMWLQQLPLFHLIPAGLPQLSDSNALLLRVKPSAAKWRLPGSCGGYSRHSWEHYGILESGDALLSVRNRGPTFRGHERGRFNGNELCASSGLVRSLECSKPSGQPIQQPGPTQYSLSQRRRACWQVGVPANYESCL